MSTMTLNKKTFRIAGLLLILCLISAAILSGTFAKYTNEYFGQDTALVAKWDLEMKAGEKEFSVSPDPVADLDLFEHAYKNNIAQKDGDDYIIAPGVDGEFTLSMTNNSDVAAAITFDITKTGANVPMEFFIGDSFPTEGNDGVLKDVVALKTALNELNEGNPITLAETTGTKEVNVLWRWAYDGTAATAGANDESDTALGTDSATADRTSYKLNIDITATQVTPE